MSNPRRGPSRAAPRGRKPFLRRKGRPGRTLSPASRVALVSLVTLAAQVGPSVVIRNRSRYVSAEDAARAAAALARQANEHFSRPAPLGWGMGVRGVRVESPDALAQPGEWTMDLIDGQGDGESLAWHDESESGVPIMIVLVEVCRRLGVPWTTSASHELLEALADPALNLAGIAADGRIIGLEVCDPVEAASYIVDDVPVSDFILPAWFDGERGPFDYMGRVDAAGGVLAGGYLYVLESGEWVERGERRDSALNSIRLRLRGRK